MRAPGLLTLLALLALSGPARADGLVATHLETGDRETRALRLADLTGDGRPEILALTEGAAGTAVHVFTSGPSGAEPARAIAILRPAELGLAEVQYLCPARLSADGPSEVVFVDRRKGVLAVGLAPEAGGGFRPGGPRLLAPESPRSGFPADGRPPLVDVAVDLDGDGIDELLLPGPDGYLLLGERPAAPLRIPLATVSTARAGPHRLLTLEWTLPRLFPGDWDGDGRTDLIGARDGEFLLFLSRPDGTFHGTARPFRALRADPDGSPASTILAADVDGDGRTDLCVADRPAAAGLFDRFETEVRLYLNPRIFSPAEPGAPAAPASVVRAPGLGLEPRLLDFDGDGDLDLLTSSLLVDMQARIQRRSEAEYRLHLFDGKAGGFEGQPCFRVVRACPEAPPGAPARPTCRFDGDFDGDGRRDLLDLADEGHVTIRRGSSETGFLSTDRYGFPEVIFRAETGPLGEVLVADVDGDGASDLLASRGGLILFVRRVR